MSLLPPVEPDDWARIEYILVLTLHIMEGKEDDFHFRRLFVRLLRKRLGWKSDDYRVTWAVGIFADRFPITHGRDGRVRWVEPEEALVYSVTPVFWDEPQLVDLARRRASRPDRRRAKEGEPYLGG
jgi:hypothetical protein